MARAKKIHTVLAEALFALCADANNANNEQAVAGAFARYCIKHNYAWLMPKIEKEMHALEQKKNGIVDAEVVSAAALSDAEQKKVVAGIAALLKKDSAHIAARFSENSAVGGGLLVRAGDYVIDGTVAATTQKLKKQLTA